MGGPLRSWEQEVILVEEGDSWKVDRLSEPQNEREEPNEPHRHALLACNASGATATTSTPTASATTGETKGGGQTPATPCPSPAPRNSGEPDFVPGYVSGRVVSIAPDHIVVNTADKGDVEPNPSFYRIWDDLWVKDIPIEVGDEITAADTPTGGPVLYVNIVNLIGTISNVRREGDILLFDMEYDVRYSGERGFDTIEVDGRARVSGTEPREGQKGQVAGRRLKDGTVLGVTVFYFDSNASGGEQPTPTEAQSGTPAASSTGSTPSSN